MTSTTEAPRLSDAQIIAGLVGALEDAIELGDDDLDQRTADSIIANARVWMAHARGRQ